MKLTLRSTRAARLVLLLSLAWCTPSWAQSDEASPGGAIEALERRVAELEARLGERAAGTSSPQGALAEPPGAGASLEGAAGTELGQGSVPSEERAWAPIFERALGSGIANPHSWLQRFNFTGYGEFHANLTEGRGPDKHDIHRLVLGVGYSFTDWISLTTEVELEHGIVADGQDGELVVEQAFVDLRFYRAFALRAGRVLTPLGIFNRQHEPPSFPGVERPSFAQVILPTTWSSDGVGVFGNPLPWLGYEAYVVSSIDGSKISALNGIRGGRIKARPSLNEVAFTGRIDLFPFATIDAGLEQSLRLGVSTFVGGLDNGDNGKDPGRGAGKRLEIYSADLSYSIWRFSLRGAIAYLRIEDAHKIGNGAASEILGMFGEISVRLFPEQWRSGVFSKFEVVLFFRYDDYNTQYRTPRGVAKNPAGNRQDYTFGVTLQVLPNLVIKADYQIRDDKTTNNLPDLVNLGLGFQF